MNTLIKLALIAVFIGASAAPVCAQKKGLNQGIKAVVNGKPALTAKVPALRTPVIPRVPNAVVSTSAVSNSVLNEAIERKTTGALGLQPLIKSAYSKVNFSEYIVDSTPTEVLLPFKPAGDIKDLVCHYFLTGDSHIPFGALDDMEVVFGDTDKLFFKTVDGKTFVDLAAAAKYQCYEDALLTVTGKRLAELAMDKFKNFVNMRNQQIINALKAANDPQFQQKPIIWRFWKHKSWREASGYFEK